MPGCRLGCHRGCLGISRGVAAFAQDVQFDYDRSANFNAYKTYQWDYKAVRVGDELLDRDIKGAVDEQLAGKGLRRVETGGDLLVGCQAGISQRRSLTASGRVVGVVRSGGVTGAITG